MSSCKQQMVRPTSLPVAMWPPLLFIPDPKLGSLPCARGHPSLITSEGNAHMHRHLCFVNSQALVAVAIFIQSDVAPSIVCPRPKAGVFAECVKAPHSLKTSEGDAHLHRHLCFVNSVDDLRHCHWLTMSGNLHCLCSSLSLIQTDGNRVMPSRWSISKVNIRAKTTQMC